MGGKTRVRIDMLTDCGDLPPIFHHHISAVFVRNLGGKTQAWCIYMVHGNCTDSALQGIEYLSRQCLLSRYEYWFRRSVACLRNWSTTSVSNMSLVIDQADIFLVQFSIFSKKFNNLVLRPKFSRYSFNLARKIRDPRLLYQDSFKNCYDRGGFEFIMFLYLEIICG